MDSNSLLKLLFEQLPIGILVTDSHGKLLHTSKRMYQMWISCGYEVPVEECIEHFSTTESLLYHLDGTPYTLEQQPLSRVISTGEIISNEMMKIRRNENWTIAQVSASPIFVDNKLEFVFISFQDVTEKIKAETAEMTAKVTAQFMAKMSHEIKTPVNGIIGMLDILSETPLTSEQHESVRIVKQSAQNLNVLLNDVLDFSDSEKTITIANHLFNTRYTFRDISTITNASTKDLQLTITIDKNLPETIYGDRQKMTQCIQNIVANALEITKRNVSMGVTSSEDQKALIIKFTIDCIKSDDSRKLSSLYTGNDIRMSVTRYLLHQMKAQMSISFESDNITTITLEFPFNTPPITKKRKSGTQNNTRILLAEDNIVNKLITMSQLKKRGYSVIAVEDGTQVLETVEKDPTFDIILMDIQMPNMGGHETCEILRSRKWNKPIIALTASCYESDRAKCFSVGMDDYMSKPFNIEVLSDRIDHWVSCTL